MFYQMPLKPLGTMSPMSLQTWTHQTREGLTLRGWHSRPTGKPLLHMLHGNGFCGRAYDPMLDKLASHFDLWISDVPGHGDSDAGERFLGWNRNADIAFEALQAQAHAFRDVPHFAVGHSFGSVLTALMLAAHPRAFKRAVLLDPVLFSPAMIMGLAVTTLTGTASLTPRARQASRRRHHWASRDDAFTALHGRGTYKGWTDEALRAFITHGIKDSPQGGVELKCTPRREAEIFSSAPAQLWSSLSKVRTPVMTLQAEHTFPFVTEGVARWQNMNDAIQTQVVPGGHCFMQEHPHDTADKVSAFLLG
jgi:pimeloyl-ACP methyl ester carboxylesterase